MAKTNWQDPKTGEIISPHISGLQEAVGKIEESIGMESINETDIPLSEVFISNDDRCRIYQAHEGKRNWLPSPTPVVKKNGDIIINDFEIDYGGGAVVFTTPILESDVLTADATYTINQSTFNENIEVAKSPIGFPNRTDSTFSFDKSTRTFTIEPTSDKYEAFFKGKKFIKDSPESIIIPNTTGLYYIYFNEDGILSASTIFPGLQNMIYISYIYWNENQAITSLQFGPGDERHGTVMDKATHERLHAIDWTQWVRGLQLYGYEMNDSTSNDAPKVSITDGVVADEDLFHDITHSPTSSSFFKQALQDFALLPIMYRDGDNGEWRQDEATEYPFKNTDLGRINFNEFDVEWKQSQVPSNGFVAYYIVFSADVEQPIKVVQGQRTDTTLADAQANNDDRDISWGNIPFQEFKVLYRLILQTSDNFANIRKAMLVDVLDLRTARRSPGGGGIIPSAHSNLTGLDYESSGHTGFASAVDLASVVQQSNENVTDVTNLKTNALQYKTNPSNDANDFIETGTYKLGTTMTNIPKIYEMGSIISTEGTLSVYKYQNGYIMQSFKSVYGGSAERLMLSGSWGSWEEVAISRCVELDLLNGWVKNDVYDAPRATLNGRVVTIDFLIEGGITTTNTAIAVLPYYMRCANNKWFNIVCGVYTSPQLAHIQIYPDGGIRIQYAPSNVNLSASISYTI
ncbi:MAG TPA: hypothetical protein GX707_09805 [Epulopiscium sp.]|nr:hypothetical protein [Candidatus Epulonipiscium sp.]